MLDKLLLAFCSNPDNVNVYLLPIVLFVPFTIPVIGSYFIPLVTFDQSGVFPPTFMSKSFTVILLSLKNLSVTSNTT